MKESFWKAVAALGAAGLIGGGGASIVTSLDSLLTARVRAVQAADEALRVQVEQQVLSQNVESVTPAKSK